MSLADWFKPLPPSLPAAADVPLLTPAQVITATLTRHAIATQGELLDACKAQGITLIQRFANPFKGNQFVYCSALYRSEPAIGDHVIELIRRRSHRAGLVERFKVYRMDGKLYPVIRWQNGMLTFGNPEMLVVIDRPEPFSVQRATEKLRVAQ